MSTKQRYSFKCQACAMLEDSGNAGERATPAACRNCGAGVAFDPATGSKTYDESNWIVLSDLTPGELKDVLDFHGLEASQVVRHKPLPSAASRDPELIDRSVEDGLAQEDKAG